MIILYTFDLDCNKHHEQKIVHWHAINKILYYVKYTSLIRLTEFTSYNHIIVSLIAVIELFYVSAKVILLAACVK